MFVFTATLGGFSRSVRVGTQAKYADVPLNVILRGTRGAPSVVLPLYNMLHNAMTNEENWVYRCSLELSFTLYPGVYFQKLS